MRDGTTGVLNVAATCATAGIIVGVVTLTGLAQRFADIIIGYAQGSLLLTAIFTAAIVWIVGLAVPVTASYIMCAVIAAPALIKLGVPDFAAHMFIFYYAVLSEVSPPTALSPFAAAAITGGNPYLTTLQSWKYTMPAFLVPFVFVLDPQGVGLLLTMPKGGSWVDIVEIVLETGAGIAMLALATQGWFLKKSTLLETVLFALGGLLLVFPAIISVIVKPLLGVDINAFVPGLSALGVRSATTSCWASWCSPPATSSSERGQPSPRRIEVFTRPLSDPTVSPRSPPHGRSQREENAMQLGKDLAAVVTGGASGLGAATARGAGGQGRQGCRVRRQRRGGREDRQGDRRPVRQVRRHQRAERRRCPCRCAQGARPGAHPRQLRRHRRGQAHHPPRQGDQRHRAARPRHLHQGDPGQPDRHVPDDLQERRRHAGRRSPSTTTPSAASSSAPRRWRRRTARSARSPMPPPRAASTP